MIKGKLQIILIVFLAFSAEFCHSQFISEDRAKNMAYNFISSKLSEGISISGVEKISNGSTFIYIIKFNPIGFVAISGDERVRPVLFYSAESIYNPTELTDGFRIMMNSYFDQIDYSIKNNIQPEPKVKQEWIKFENTNKSVNKIEDTESIQPLLKTKWNQTYPYNKYCPEVTVGGSGGRAYAGCVAVAMAQVLKYHEKPSSGRGSKGYHLEPFGYLSVNFGVTSYDWSNMSNDLSTENDSVKINETAKIVYHCGIAAETIFDGKVSGATITNAYTGFKEIFYYNIGAILLRSHNPVTNTSYTANEWSGKIISELECRRPVIYNAGDKYNNEKHVFVIDGYDTQGFFHINWGWGGANDGYYSIDNLVPAGYNFGNSHEMISYIIPIAENKLAPMLIRPSNDEVSQKLTTFFEWKDNYPDGNSLYQLIVSRDTNMINILVDYKTSNQLYTINLEENSKYYWKVGVTKGGKVYWSDIQTFIVIGNYPITLKYPENNSKCFPHLLKPRFEWDYFLANSQSSYIVLFYTDSNSQSTSIFFKSNQNYGYLEKDLEYNTKYYWKVYDQSSYRMSQLSSFQTAAADDYKPYSYYPDLNSTNINPQVELSWKYHIMTPDTQRIRIELSKDPFFDPVIFRKDTTMCDKINIFRLDYDNVYYWRIGLILPYNSSILWSKTIRFSTEGSNLEILNAYPNPFNSETFIKFNMRGSGFLTVKIYDLLGREVETLHNSRAEGLPGLYWRPKNLSTGIYFCNIKFNDQQKWLKLNYLK